MLGSPLNFHQDPPLLSLPPLPSIPAPSPEADQRENTGTFPPQVPAPLFEDVEGDGRREERSDFQMHPLGYFINHADLQNLAGLSFQWLRNSNISPTYFFAFGIFFDKPAPSSVEQQLNISSRITHFFRALENAVLSFIRQGITQLIPLRDVMGNVFTATCRTYSGRPAFHSLLLELPFLAVIDIFIISRMSHFLSIPTLGDNTTLNNNCLATIDSFISLSENVTFLSDNCVLSRNQPSL